MTDQTNNRPAKEPLDVWWPKYLARVDESVNAAELHFEIPVGTISSIARDPDYIATVKTYAVIEPMLNDLIAARPPMAIFGSLAPALALDLPEHPFQTFVAHLNISGRTGKIALAKGLGLLRADQVRFVEGVARIRNRYAHNVKNMHRPLVEILAEEQRGNGKIVEDVTGIMDCRLPSPDMEPFLKIFMYHRLADYLSDALKTIKPPPLPMGGLLGLGAGMFGPAPAASDDKSL
jgi:hypothetical protein